jgi:hypothetical protein
VVTLFLRAAKRPYGPDATKPDDYVAEPGEPGVEPLPATPEEEKRWSGTADANIRGAADRPSPDAVTPGTISGSCPVGRARAGADHRAMPRSLPIALACAALAWLAGAGSAKAATYCVIKPSCTGTHTGNFQDALDMAQASSNDADTIELGPETFFTVAGFEYDSGGMPANHVKISGTPGKTVLRSVDPTLEPSSFSVLTLKGAGSAGSSVANLEVQVPGAEKPLGAPSGIVLRDAAAEHVKVTALPGAASKLTAGIQLLEHSRVRFADVVVPGHGGWAIAASGSANVIEDVAVAGGWTGIYLHGDGQVARARVDARGGTNDGVVCSGCDYELDDTSIRVDGDDDGLSAMSGGEIDASHVTIVGDPPNTATAVFAYTAGYGNAIVRVDNCILQTVGTTLKRQANPADPGFAAVVTRNCNYVAGKESESGPGFIDAAAHITHGPYFVNQLAGDFRLLWSSPMIDAGRNATFADSPWTLDALARIVDGDGNGSATPDLGAFEYQALPPVADIDGPSVVTAGQPVTFDGSASTGGDPGEPVTYQWKLPGGATATTPAVTLTPPAGQQLVSLTVKDPTAKTTSTLKFYLATTPPQDPQAPADPAPEPPLDPAPKPLVGPAPQPPAEPAPQPPADPAPQPLSATPEPPVGPLDGSQQPQPALLSGVRVQPGVFRRGRRARVELTLGRPAQVGVRLERRAAGRWRAKRTIVRSLSAGPARVALPRRLAVGRWRAVVRTGDTTASARFRVR